MRHVTPKTNTAANNGHKYLLEQCAELERENARLREKLNNIKAWADQSLSGIYDKEIAAAFEQISDEADISQNTPV